MKMNLFVAIVALGALEVVTASVHLKGGFLKGHYSDLPDLDEVPVPELDDLPEHLPVQWPAESQLPLSVQYLLAFTWIILLSSIPLLLPVMERHPPTRTQMSVGGAMLVVVIGGFYLFTHVILFQSGHFKTIRTLTSVECIYFMAQVITTVGYGDITPAKSFGQVFVAMYVLGALFIIAMLISDLIVHMMTVYEEHKETQRAKRLAIISRYSPVAAQRHPAGRDPLAESHLEQEVDAISMMLKRDEPSVRPLLAAFLIFLALDVCWIIFFSSYPGEDKTLFQASYMSVITLSTVGFGWFTPVTEAGMIFASFWMLFGSAALVAVIGEFTELMVKLHEFEKPDAEWKEAAMANLREISSGRKFVTELEFLCFGLVEMKCVDKDDLDDILEDFSEMNPKNGNVSRQYIEQLLSKA